MKVFHLTYGFTFGGIETMLVNLANNQARLGHDVTVIVINDLVDPTLRRRLDSNVKFHCMGRSVKSRNPMPFLKMNMIMRRERPDVIHLHYASISRYILSKAMRRRLCVTLHAMTTPINSRYLHKSGPVVAISDVVKDDIKKVTGLDSTTIFNGVDVESFMPRTKLRKGGEPMNIVEVSRLAHEIKGQDILLRAVKILRDRDIGDIRVSFIGDGDSASFLKGLTHQLGLDDCVTFLGSRPQDYIFENLRNYDLLVQPSRYEGFGITVAEGMAARVPVLVTNIQGPMEVIGYGEYGDSFKTADEADCAAHLLEIYRRGDIPEKIEAAYRRASEAYGIAGTARKYLGLYRQQVIDRV